MFSRLHVLTSLVRKFVPVAMLLAASTHLAMAQTFLHAPTLATGETPTYVASGDLNGDGKPDSISANLYAKSLSLFLGNGAGKFKPAITISLGVTPPRWRSLISIAMASGILPWASRETKYSCCLARRWERRISAARNLRPPRVCLAGRSGQGWFSGSGCRDDERNGGASQYYRPVICKNDERRLSHFDCRLIGRVHAFEIDKEALHVQGGKGFFH